MNVIDPLILKSECEVLGSSLDLHSKEEILNNYSDYLRDESRFQGSSTSSLIFPRNAEELQSILLSPEFSQSNIFLSGARTGVSGGAVPVLEGNSDTLLLSLEKMQTISEVLFQDEQAFVWLGAGVSLIQLEEYLKEHEPSYCFPVDPTEKWASFGGLAVTNASSARSFKYSSVRKWIQAIEVVTVSGDRFMLERGVHTLLGNSFIYKGQEYTFPSISKPHTKNSIGYSYYEGMDLVDLFIGSEGTLGIITSLKIQLSKKPHGILSLLQFFSCSERALDFVIAARERLKENTLSLEFLDEKALSYAMKGEVSFGAQISRILSHTKGGVIFAEFEYDSDETFEALIVSIESEILAIGEKMENGVCAMTETEVQEMKRFRHAVPEALNALVAERKLTIPELRKVATDMSVPSEHLHGIYKLYCEYLNKEGLEYAIFGHAGDNHFHVNMLPQSLEQMQKALELYKKIAEDVVRLGGAVSAEHGIGRLKKDFLKIQYNSTVIEGMKDIKRVFDPSWRLNRGVLFD